MLWILVKVCMFFFHSDHPTKEEKGCHWEGQARACEYKYDLTLRAYTLSDWLYVKLYLWAVC